MHTHLHFTGLILRVKQDWHDAYYTRDQAALPEARRYKHTHNVK